MAGVAAHGDSSVGVRRAIGVDGVGAVVLLVGFAVSAGQIGRDLGAHASAIANLEVLHILADLDDLADDFVADAERKRDIGAPATGDGVDVTGADAAGVNGNVDVAVAKGLQLELLE